MARSNFEVRDLYADKVRRELRWLEVMSLLYDYGTVNLGLSVSNVLGKIDDLYLTFAAEWVLFFLTGSDAVVTAIQSPEALAALPWLDTDISGQPLRARLIARLNG